jgi:hypothetical protein
VDDIGEHRYHSHTQLSSSALLCLQSTSYPPSALQNRARRAAGIREWCNGVLFFLNALRCVSCCDGTTRIAHLMPEHAQIVFDLLRNKYAAVATSRELRWVQMSSWPRQPTNQPTDGPKLPPRRSSPRRALLQHTVVIPGLPQNF